MNSNDVIRSIRVKRNLNQCDIAKSLKVTRQTYNGYENNILGCDLETIFKLINILEVNGRELEEFLNAMRLDYKAYREQNED